MIEKINKNEIKKFSYFSLQNFGIYLVGIYYLLDVGSLQGVFPILQSLKVALILSLVSIVYAIYLLFRGLFSFSSSASKSFLIICIFIIFYSLISTDDPIYRTDIPKLFLIYLAHYIIIVATIKTKEQFILLVDIWLLSLLHSSFHGIMQG